eukprot:CAMPEP_0177727640 /NCGR_PEP_ID=MMETSP0484_2-20121128/20434_1 /TAXON_ID=354590 /ORGANISM="Rhodomonas lens, Strain RHODO" /LENGTH=118 /DNA_ID=CAMNT_0019240317 /DNA_START=6 /DNA_END=362 /DNA_ORIENTATION=-
MAATRPPVTSHVLDTARGMPGSGMSVTLSMMSSNGEFQKIGSDVTNADGRCPQLLDVGHKLIPGVYRCTFDTKAYFEATGQRGFFPEVAVMFEVESTTEHYHIPLLLSPFGYSTYRGS